MSEAPYTEQELMVAVASREIRDGDLVFVGMRLPILAYAVARSTHAPTARGLFEVGLMRDSAASGYLGTMGDPPNVDGALWATRMSDVMALMAQGLAGGARAPLAAGRWTGGDHHDAVRVPLPRRGRRGLPGLDPSWPHLRGGPEGDWLGHPGRA